MLRYEIRPQVLVKKPNILVKSITCKAKYNNKKTKYCRGSFGGPSPTILPFRPSPAQSGWIWAALAEIFRPLHRCLIGSQSQFRDRIHFIYQVGNTNKEFEFDSTSL
ncbi:hypothetical protein XENOCAPTIV_023440 [Xenoophorus captivus]|uniref:Uncharacterized protein n=1 Tax=Xenoophorus captivus TaxID=1517983 RepID=A0ABV0QWC1_9TELE